MKAEVVRSDTTSRCTAFVARQTKMQMKAIYLDWLPCVSLPDGERTSKVKSSIREGRLIGLASSRW